MNETGLDGPTEDDIPMMHVGPPTITDPNQVTSKPRQIPSSGGAPGDPEGSNPFGDDAAGDAGDDAEGLDFDPNALGGPEQSQRAEGNEPEPPDIAGATQPGATLTSKAVRVRMDRIIDDVWTENPGLSATAVADVVADVMVSSLRREASSMPQIRFETGAYGGSGLGDLINGIQVNTTPLTNRDGTPMVNQDGHALTGSPAQQMELHTRQFLKEKAADGVQRWKQRRRNQSADPATDSEPEGPEGQGEPLPPERPETPSERVSDQPMDSSSEGGGEDYHQPERPEPGTPEHARWTTIRDQVRRAREQSAQQPSQAGQDDR